MSLKNLFGNSSKPISSTNLESNFKDIESAGNFEQQINSKQRYIPSIDYTTASNFAIFGSAEEYYKTALSNIANTFPYDGSRKEVAEFLNNSSYIDLYVFNNLYPRYNGYVTISSNGWGSIVGSQINGIGKPSTLEYIYVKGGPHTASTGMEGVSLNSTFDYANKYETDVYATAGVLSEGRKGTRESNFKTNFDNGVTVEFWLKKTAFDTAKTAKEVIFDLWNGEASSSLSCGRMIVALSGNAGTPDEGLYFVIQSGSTILQTAIPGFPTGTIIDGTWHHYAISMANTGSNLGFNFYLDGSKVYSNDSAVASLGEITGALNATIGALQTCPPIVSFHGLNCTGSAKLSASLDEFRFWKAERDQEQIVDNRWVQVGGGTNTDISNTELGVYFKFNEGITGTSSYDSVVLDYSGRISNGVWTGYPGSSARSTGSAMVESGLAETEFKDPVIYTDHPEYISTYNTLTVSGNYYDQTNASSLYRTYPSWIIEEDEETHQELKKLNQIVSSVFDSIYLQMKEMNTFKDPTYGIGTPLSESNVGAKPFIGNDRLLESFGLNVQDLFSNQTLMEYIQNRTKETQFDLDLTEVKNQIYKNIYSNLVYIFKSKGTEKSIRNMLRSIGINEEFIKLNAYSNNGEFRLEDTYEDDTIGKKYINFYKTDHFNATVFQSASSNPNTNSRNYVSGAYDAYQAFTSEINVIFPKKLEPKGGTYYDTPFSQSSVFGIHIVSDTSSFDWPATAASDTNFELYAVRPDLESDQAYFLLKDRNNTFQITSSLYKNVYQNSEWTFGVRVYNNKYPYADGTYLSGSSTIGYLIDFVGYNTEGSYVRNSFALSASLVNASGSSLVTSNKRYYAGAHRQNFTGSVQHRTDIKLGFIRHYETYLDNEAIRIHSIDRSNFGSTEPQKNEFLFRTNTFLTGTYLPKINLNDLNVDFETVTGSDSTGKFLAVDYSSGSVSAGSKYPFIGTTLYTQHEFIGYDFPANSNSVVSREILIGSSLRSPEAVNSSDLVNVLNRDDELYTRDNSVYQTSFALEKSYYATVTKEMLDFFGGVVAFNNLIGDVAEKYKDEYSRLEYLRTNFFDRITSVSSFERFYSYYKWLDDAIANFVSQLIPESAVFQSNVRDLIESHVLERNKIKYQYPMLDVYGNTRFGEPTFESNLKGSRQHLRSWRFTSPPFVSGSLVSQQNYSTGWWKNILQRTDPRITSGDTQVDSAREILKKVKNKFDNSDNIVLANSDNSEYKTLKDNNPEIPENLVMNVDSQNNGTDSVGTGANTKFNKNLKTFRNLINPLTKNSVSTLYVSASANQIINQDKLDIRRNIKINHTVEQYSIDGTNTTEAFYLKTEAEKLFPFTFVSKSVNTKYASQVTTAEVGNIHLDTQHNDLSVSLQTPFTEDHVGGYQYRHQGLQTSPTASRAEGFKIIPTATGFEIKGPQGVSGSSTPDTTAPFGIYARHGQIAKSPVNMRNIKRDNKFIGSYAKESDIVFTTSRATNNRAFVKAEGFNTSSVTSSYINNFYDFAKPDYSITSGSVYGDKSSGISSQVIVSRFSSPGGPETAGDTQGGPGLDYLSSEYSPYNNLNYRNLTVRQPLRSLLSQRSERFGIASGSTLSELTYDNTASFHKYHRNGTKVVTQNSSNDFSVANSSSIKYRYDNAYVSTPIPANESQYSWVTASMVSGTNILGYQTYDGYDIVSSSFVEQIPIISASSVSTGRVAGTMYFGGDINNVSATEKVPVDFAGLNYAVVEPFNSDTIGYEAQEYVSGAVNTAFHTILPTANFGNTILLNALLSHRQGPYGYSTFKQLRVGNNPLTRLSRKLNVYSYNSENTTPFDIVLQVSGGATSTITLKDRYAQTSTKFVQTPVTSRYSPIYFAFGSIRNDGTISKFAAQAPYGGVLTFLSDDKYNNELNLKTSETVPAKKLMEYYKVSDKLGALEMRYRETVFPAEANTYLKKSRQRNNFTVNYWRDSKEDRITLGKQQKNKSVLYSYNRSRYERSSWDLDVYPEFDELNFDNYPNPSVNQLVQYFYSGSGILQNYTTFNRYYHFFLGPTRFSGNVPSTNLNVQPTYARPHFEYQYKSVVSPFGMDIYLSSGTNVKNIGYNSFTTGSLVGSGYAKWEAPALAGKYVRTVDANGAETVQFQTSSVNPFYDTYEDFIADPRLVAKEYAIIPEFRMSDFAESLLNKQKSPYILDDFLTNPQINNSLLPKNSSEDQFYEIFTNSEFLKHFEVVKEVNKDFLEPDMLTLRCKVLKKFLPYNGFYPAERTAEIAEKFFQSYADSITHDGEQSSINESNRLRPVMQTLFAPGILYNTIKSGIAVDYPIYTSSYAAGARYMDSASSEYYYGLKESFDTRIPFEAVYEPSVYLNGVTIYDNEPMTHTRIGDSASTRLRNRVNINSGKTPYIYAINNFLAESTNFFLENSQQSTILSAPESDFKAVVPGKPYGMRVKMWRSMDTPRPISGSWGNWPVPQDTAITNTTQDYYIILNQTLAAGGIGEIRAYYNPQYGLYNDWTYLFTEDYQKRVSVNSAITNLTMSVTLSGAAGSYTITGTGSAWGAASLATAHYTATTFDIDSDINNFAYTDDNARNTMIALRDSINASPANAEFIASYLGAFEIQNDPNVSESEIYKERLDPIAEIIYKGTIQRSLDTRNKNGDLYKVISAETYHVVKISTTSPFINATIAVSNSASPSAGTYDALNPVVDSFFFTSSVLPSTILDGVYMGPAFNAVTSSFPGSGSTTPKETFTMYSRPSAFGPPVLGITGNVASTSIFQSVQDSGRGLNYAFTPPYYHGESWLDIIYYPGSSSNASDSNFGFKPAITSEANRNMFSFPFGGIADVTYLQDGIYTFSYRFDPISGSNPGSDLMMQDYNININSMQLEASLNPFEVITDSNGNRRWAIKTKYETPMLNFNYLSSSSDVTYPTGALSASVPRGMWHQFGRIPQGDEGVFISVENIPTSWINSLVYDRSDAGALAWNGKDSALYTYNSASQGPIGDLADICGFARAPVKLGKLSQTRTIKEAIVAIPFVEEAGQRRYFEIDRNMATYIKQAIKYVEEKQGTITSIEDFVEKANLVKLQDIPTGNSQNIDNALKNTSVANMLIKANFYVLPPAYDFVNFSVKPVSMYIFEFEHTFDSDDLSHIWQNLPPKLGTTHELGESIISHPLLSNELLGDWKKTQNSTIPTENQMPGNLKWMVFKVKQRAKKDYKLMAKNIQLISTEESKVSFNWPYDYFSMIELAKIDAEVVFTPNRTKVKSLNSPDIAKLGKLQNVTDNLVLQSGRVSTEPVTDDNKEEFMKIIQKNKSAKREEVSTKTQVPFHIDTISKTAQSDSNARATTNKALPSSLTTAEREARYINYTENIKPKNR